MEHLIKPNLDAEIMIDVTPASAGWHYLSFKVMSLMPGSRYEQAADGIERALVPLSGSGRLEVAGTRYDVARENVFAEKGATLYVPPEQRIVVEAKTHFEFAIGGAPAEGKYPTRLFMPDEMRVEVRGGGPAHRQVNHTLSAPMPAERLILYEVYVPGGAWSGWPPHCHDGYMGSPYLEEIYYYRIDPEEGFAIHRNYRLDTEFDELLPVKHGDLVLVTEGFHPVAAAPGSSVYFLNYLAGELLDEARATPPYDDPRYAWIKDNWERNLMRLPLPGH